jgi:hippurate hydrolase
VRTLSGAVRDRVEALLAEAAAAATVGATAEVRYERACPPTVNSAAEAERAALAAEEVLGAGRVMRGRAPVMMGEDFAFMLLRRPGCYALLGMRGPDGRGAVPPHHPGYDFNDDLLPIGASYFAALVKQQLPPE